MASNISAPQTLTSPPSILSFDVTEEILLRLPVKSLSKFRCVCKSWDALISDPEFAKKHLERRRKEEEQKFLISSSVEPFSFKVCPLHAMFTTSFITTLNYPLTRNKNKRFHSMVGSYDGILCMAVDRRYALLWNPTTRKLKHLPPVVQNPLASLSGSFTVFSFGHDSLTNAYKVVAVFCYPCDDDARVGAYGSEVRVFTLGTNSNSNSWRRIKEFPSAEAGIPFDKVGKFVSGSINWLAYSDWRCCLPAVIVTLDLGNESYGQILQPDYGHGPPPLTLSLGVLKSCLCILPHYDTYLDV